MHEIEFRSWMRQRRFLNKAQSDHVSRLKRFERELNIDIDEQYNIDKCVSLLEIFKNSGRNEKMKKYGEISLPIGKYHLSTYKYAINKYILFRNEYHIK